MFLKGIASGNVVEENKIVSRYPLSDFDCGKGLTQSMRTTLKDFKGWDRLKRRTGNLLIRFSNHLTNMT